MNRLPLLKVSENKRFLVQDDGKPFFWLGDTAWELFHKLNREEAELYLRNRAERKFNVIQAVALAELDGLKTANAYGRKPLKQNARGEYDPALPDTEGEYSYWSHVDYIVEKAAELGLYIALLPTWGDKYHKAHGDGPVIFTEDNARAYGRWLGDRYKHHTNIVWVLGGDRELTKALHFAVNRAMAEGLSEGDGGVHLRTFHPKGYQSSSHHVHEEPWLDFNMVQSGHGMEKTPNSDFIHRDYQLTPVKPVLDGEPCYEDHPRGFKPAEGYYDEADVRKAAYYAVFAGGFGHTYGHHSIWSMTTEPGDYFIMDWQTAILRPGAAQMQHLRFLLKSNSYLERVPDQELIAENRSGANYMVATRGSDYALIYSPNGIRFKVVMGRFGGKQVHASWFDPRNGERRTIGVVDNEGVKEFVPPTSGRGNDWVLVLESKAEADKS